MNEQAIRKIFPRASKSTIEANANGGETGAESERALRDGPLAKAQGKARYAGRYVVSVTSYRVRTVDPDNLCAKWFIDSLRYAGILHDDRESDIIYQISQKKVAHKTEEKTLIEIWPEQSS